MPDHYFTQNPSSMRGEGQVQFTYRGAELAFTTDSGTFSRGRVDPGSALLLEAMGKITGLCADIGCGWGAIGLSLAAANPEARFVLIDINERAAELARRNAERNDLCNIEVISRDGLTEQQFDAVVTNPPVRAGKETVLSFFAQAHARLREGGTLTVVLRVKQGAPSAKAYLGELFGNCETVSRGGGYHVMRCVKEKLS